jgi:hypothetical protein
MPSNNPQKGNMMMAGKDPETSRQVNCKLDKSNPMRRCDAKNKMARNPPLSWFVLPSELLFRSCLTDNMRK